MSRIVLTDAQREAIETAKREGKRRISMELTDSQQKAMREVDSEVDAEKESIVKRGKELRGRSRERKQRIAAQLRAAREAAGMSLADVAAATGMTRQAILRIESGENVNPTLSTIRRIAEALGKSVDITLVDAA